MNRSTGRDSPTLPTGGGTNGRTVLLVRGAGGLLDGVLRAVPPGRTLVVGRSRSCHLSLRRTPAFRRLPDPLATMASRAFLRVSRVHCEIAHVGRGRVEIHDLSANGTLVDDRRVSRSVVVDPGRGPVDVVLGDVANGTLTLTLTDGATLPRR